MGRLCLSRLLLLAVVGVVAPALAQDAPPGVQRPRDFPQALPDGWRMLGDDEPTPGERSRDPFAGGPLDGAPDAFDFRRDGAIQPVFPRRGEPTAPDGTLLGRDGAAPPAPPRDPARDEAALKAARDKARAEELKKALAPKPEPAVLRREALDKLFAQLAAQTDPRRAQVAAAAIQHIWMQSQSDTASLVMQRALAAIDAKNFTVALTLLDRLVAIAPDWAEAWNERATARFLTEDADGAMADIDKVLRLEPRHFAALAGMGVILQRAGLERRALEAFSKALEVYPAQPVIQETVEKLSLKVNGRDI